MQIYKCKRYSERIRIPQKNIWFYWLIYLLQNLVYGNCCFIMNDIAFWDQYKMLVYFRNAKVTRGSDLSLVPRNPWLELEEGGVRPRSANWCHWMILVLMVTERMCCIPSIIFSTSIIISTSHHIIIDTSKYYKVEYGQNVLHTKYHLLNKYYHLNFTSYHHRNK